MDIASEKNTIRTQAQAARRAIGDDRRAALSSAACMKLASYLDERLGAAPGSQPVVAIYQATGDELSLEEAALWLYARGAKVAFPCTRSAERMDFFVVDEATWRDASLPFLAQPGRFFSDARFEGIEQVSPDRIDAIVVPGSAFDLQGMRVGSGAGCYDRYLPHVREDCHVAGVAFDEQIFQHVPAGKHDHAVHAVVTPTRIITPPSVFDPIAYINEPRWRQVKPGLERIAELLERLGRPQDRTRFVHVAGTNGKGSTCSYLARILQEAGYKTGLFTSPYILRFEDRIRVNGEEIPYAKLDGVTRAVRDAATSMVDDGLEHPTEFELMCAVAFEHFARERCDIVVAEVGLGGRLDATNVIERPEACVITRIGIDHTAILGDTLEQIAGEKAGIIKSGAPVVSYPQDPEAMAVVERAARAKGCTLTVADFSQLSSLPLDEAFERRFSYRGTSYTTELLGSYQPENAAVAIDVVDALRSRGWNIPSEAVRSGIAHTAWPGRFEIASRNPVFIIDGGHNPQGARALASSLHDIDAAGRTVFLMGFLADKDVDSMLDELVGLGAGFVCIAPPSPRAMPAEELAQRIRNHVDRTGAPVRACGSVDEALNQAFALARTLDGAPVCACGSLYSIADIRHAATAKGIVR